MKMYMCTHCQQQRQEDDPGATFKEVISYDVAGRFIGATRLMTCGSCAVKKKPPVIDEGVPKEQSRLF